MNIALVTLTKPMSGSGDGLTEYTYQLYSKLRTNSKRNIQMIYALNILRRNDVGGLIYANTLFRNRIEKLAKADFDIIHVTHQDMGFIPKVLKKNGSKAKIITTIYDMIRYRRDMHKGFLQGAYNEIIKRNIRDAIKYSDFIIFGADQTKRDAEDRFGRVPNSAVVNPGIKKQLLKATIRRKKNKHKFTVGYLGALAYHKNTKMILEAARTMNNPNYEFLIYGTGIEGNALLRYKEEHKLYNVVLKGFAPEEKIAEIYDSFDVFVFPSKYEGLAYPPLEALARGIPVIINKKGAGIVPDEAKKYVYSAEDPEQMAETIKMLKENGYDEKKREAAMRYARTFTWDNATNDTYKIYLKLVEK